MPRGTAITITIAACASDLSTLEKTLPITTAPLDTGVLRTLSRKPKRLSQTIDIPLNMAVKSVTKESMPTARKEK
jgi:hypothetical protein